MAVTGRGFDTRGGHSRPRLPFRLAGGALAIAAGIAAVQPMGRHVDAANPDPKDTIYVADYGASAVDVFAAGANGNVTPLRRLVGAATGLSGPAGIAIDAAGNLFVSGFNNNSITVYSAGAGGNAAPIRTISGANTGLATPDDISITPDGTLFVGDTSTATVLVFAPGANGNATPVRRISGSNTGFSGNIDGVGVDAAGNLFVANSSANSIAIFAPGANGNVAPARTVSGGNTGLSNPDDVKPTFAGGFVVTNESGGSGGGGSVEAFAPGATGNATPTRSISGSNTGMNVVDDLGLSSNGSTYVTNFIGNSVTAYGPAQVGNVAPIATIAGSNTTFVNPEGVILAPPPAATLTTHAAASVIPLGGSTHDTADLTGTGPTGSIVFKLFGPADSTCSAAPKFTSSPVAVSGNGSYSSPGFTPAAMGTYHWVALYSGDTNNGPAATACADPAETVQVSSLVTTVFDASTNAQWSGKEFAGASAYDTASIAFTGSPAPTGNVTYSRFDNGSCSGTAASTQTVTVNADGTVPRSAATGALNAGSYSFSAAYEGDTRHPASTAPCEPFSVKPIPVPNAGGGAPGLMTLALLTGGVAASVVAGTGLRRRARR